MQLSSFMVLENMGLSGDQVSMIVALALGINPILDMFETCCNVAGDNVCTAPTLSRRRTALLWMVATDPPLGLFSGAKSALAQ